MKVVLVGTNHAGTSFARTLKTVDKNAELIAFDKNDNISFLGCGIALWVEGEFENPDGLFYSDEKQLREKFNVDVRMKQEIISINEKSKIVVAKNLETQEEYEVEYDKLVYAAGSWPIQLPIPGIDAENILYSKIFQHAQVIKKANENPEVKNVVVVGAGYIGIELVDAFAKCGKNVVLVDMLSAPIGKYFDKEFTDPLEESMKKAGVTIACNEKLMQFEKHENGSVKSVVTDKSEYDADLVIMATGFTPQTKMLEGIVDLHPQTKAIIVDEHMQTSDPDIYALGDSVQLKHNVLENAYVALATNAVKTGIVAAMNIAGSTLDFPGVTGTNAIKVFGHNYSSTGISEQSAKVLGLENIASSFILDKDRAEFMKTVSDVKFKIVYEKDSLKLIGAQVGSEGTANHTEIMLAMSLAIQKGMTLPEIALIDNFFIPHFNKPFNFILQSILNALGLKY